MNKVFKTVLQISIISCFMFLIAVPTASAAYFDPRGGEYYGPVYTEIYFGLNPTYYTTDGTDPRTSETRHLGQYYLERYVAKNTTFRVVMCTGNVEHELIPDGPEFTASYVISDSIPAPAVDLSSGTYQGPREVKSSILLANNYDNLTGWYTLDGSDPRSSNTRQQFFNRSASLEKSILINYSGTLKIAYNIEYKSHSFWSDLATNYWTPVTAIDYQII